jgi:probable HAF family extracellular repeat protein
MLSAAFVVGCGVDNIQAPSPSARLPLLERAISRSETAFDFTTIDVPGAMSTSASGISARGEIVGSYVDGSKRSHGYVLHSSRSHGYVLHSSRSHGNVLHYRNLVTIDFTTSDGIAAAGTEAKGISPKGEVVGDYWMPDGAPVNPVNIHGYRWTKKGDFVPVNYPGHAGTIVQRILPDGTMLGCRHDGDLMNTMKGITMSRAGNTEISQFSSMENGATPDRRRIVGLYKNDATSPQRGFVIADGVFTPLFLDATTPALAAWDINPAGEIVGVYSNAAGVHGFVLSGDGYATLDFPGAAQTRAFGINARGEVVGTYIAADGTTHGFLASQGRKDER